MTAPEAGLRWFAPGWQDSDGNAHALGPTTVIREHAEAATAELREKETRFTDGNPDQIITVTHLELPWEPVLEEES